MKKFFSLFFILASTAAFGQVESYQTTIYTSDELADEIQSVVDENQSRGLGADMFAAGANALLGIGTGYISSAMDFSVNLIGQLVTKNAEHRENWEETIKKENEYTAQINTIAELNDFYDSISFDGPMDPKGMRFNGIGCLKMHDKDTSFFMSCHINKDKIYRIVNHSKFELVLDTLVINPFKCNLPNTNLDIPFSFEQRGSFTLNIAFTLSSSWMDQLPQMNKDQVLGSFSLNIPISKDDLASDGMFRYIRVEEEEPKYDILGESFIVPRSYMSIRDNDNRMRHTWGTGEYKLSMVIVEKCGISKEYRENWKKDYKLRKRMQPKETIWKGGWKMVTSQKWDEIGKSWVITTLKAPADVLTDAIKK
ncbi:MAG: hypothetical protein MJY73_04330 [Bacteroidales bacterium]|nr:hypothetical protein [Bacteroidales bacterium]